MSGNPYLDDHEEQLAALVPDAPPAVVLPVPAAHPALAPYAPHVQQGYGPGADQAAYEAALQSRDDSDAKAKLYSALTMINKGGGGSGLDQGQAAQTAHRDDAIKAVLQRRALADSDVARAKEQRMTALTEALSHYDSPETIRAREQWHGTTVGKRIHDMMGEEAFNRLTGDRIPGAKEQLASETQLALAGLKAGAKGGDEEAKRLAALESLRNVDPNMAAKFEHAPYDTILKAGFALVKQNRAIGNTNTQKGIDRGLADAPAKEESKMLADAVDAMDTAKARSGVINRQLDAHNASERLEVLTEKKMLTPEDVKLIAVLRATIARGGGAPTLPEIQSQIPHTLRGQGAEWASYLLSQPRDAGLGAFIEQAKQVSRGEKATIDAQVHNELARRVPKLAVAIRKYPDIMRGAIKNAGFDLEKDFDPKTLQFLHQSDPIKEGARRMNARPPIRMPNGKLMEEGPDGHMVEVKQ